MELKFVDSHMKTSGNLEFHKEIKSFSEESIDG